MQTRICIMTHLPGLTFVTETFLFNLSNIPFKPTQRPRLNLLHAQSFSSDLVPRPSAPPQPESTLYVIRFGEQVQNVFYVW